MIRGSAPGVVRFRRACRVGAKHLILIRESRGPAPLTLLIRVDRRLMRRGAARRGQLGLDQRLVQVLSRVAEALVDIGQL